MANFNTRNNGTVIGRLAANPTIYTNTDGSRKARFSVVAQRPYYSSDPNKRFDTDLISVEKFFPKDKKIDAVIESLHQGDTVAVAYTIRSNTSVDDNGKKEFYMALNIVDIAVMNRKKAAAKTETEAPAEAPATEAMPQEAMELLADDAVPFDEEA